MKTGKPFNSQHAASPPPGAGRTFLGNSKTAENSSGASILRRVLIAEQRQLAAERDANLTPPDGNDTGTSSRDVP
jgi:hypothetical protein